MTDDINRLTPAERWQRSPRPLDFVKVRLTLESAQYLDNLLTDERAQLFEDLTRLRGEGKEEGDPDLAQTVFDLRRAISVQKEVSKALIELVGPERP